MKPASDHSSEEPLHVRQDHGSAQWYAACNFVHPLTWDGFLNRPRAVGDGIKMRGGPIMVADSLRFAPYGNALVMLPCYMMVSRAYLLGTLGHES